MCQKSHKDSAINPVICLIFHLILMAIGVINPTFVTKNPIEIGLTSQCKEVLFSAKSKNISLYLVSVTIFQ
jgi:hypothetical protein